MTLGFNTRPHGGPGPPPAGIGAVASRVAFAGVVGVALVVALGFRLAGLERRPMHHDEANQAVKFGVLLETGDYRYDRTDHHGPTLYYFTLPVAWARGQPTLASLDERTVRIVPALFGTGLVLLMAVAGRGLGRTAGAAAACLAAVSPALTYFSRFYIQESIFAFLALAFLLALGRYAERPTMAAAITAGACAGLAYATKETSVIVLPAAILAVVLARAPWGRGAQRRMAGSGRSGRRVHAIRAMFGLATALVIALLFYSSFLKHPEGLLDSILAFGVFVDRGVGAGPYSQPWDYYLRLLSWSSSGGLVWTEALVLVLALFGLVAAIRPAAAPFWPRAVAIYAVVSLVAFSSIPYKTPWNLLPFYAGIVLLAGVGVQALLAMNWGQSRTQDLHSNLTPLVARGVVVLVLVAAACHLGVQAWRANGRYAIDPRNPYVYAQTSADFLRLVQRVADVAAIHPDREDMLVRVIAGPYEQWPLPWYLRRMTHVGYWPRAADAGPLVGTPVIIASQDNAGAVGAALGERYVSEFYGLRADVILTVYIERSLWDRYLASRLANPWPPR